MCPSWLLVVAVLGVARGAASQCWEQPSCQDLSSESNMLDCLHLCHKDLLTEESPVFPGEAHLLQTPVFSSSLSLSSSSSDPAAADPPSSLLLPPASSSLLAPSDPQQTAQVRSPARRSYSMEHFRWGKPVGRKRRPIKTPSSSSSSSSSSSDPAAPPYLLLPPRSLLPVASDPQQSQAPAVGVPARRSYHMGHFRWGKPKRSPIKVYTSAGGAGTVMEEPADSSDELGFLPSEMRRELLTNEVLQAEEEVGVLTQDDSAAAAAVGGPVEERRDGNSRYKMGHFRWSGPPASKRYGGFMKSWDERTQKPLLTLFKNVIHQDAAGGVAGATEQE